MTLLKKLKSERKIRKLQGVQLQNMEPLRTRNSELSQGNKRIQGKSRKRLKGISMNESNEMRGGTGNGSLRGGSVDTGEKVTTESSQPYGNEMTKNH